MSICAWQSFSKIKLSMSKYIHYILSSRALTNQVVIPTHFENNMELLSKDEVCFIAELCSFPQVLNWSFQEFEDKVVGYLGDHLNLIIEVERQGVTSTITLFVKCMPRFDKWKADYLKEVLFFKKEYIMLSKLFKEFDNPEGEQKWTPKLLFVKEDIFVFENVALQGYKMPHHRETMLFEELKAAVETLARFHAQSLIFEEIKSKELGRPYRIWEDYSDYLQEPRKGQEWRDVGRNAVIDFLIEFSKHKSKPNFAKYLKATLRELFDKALVLMKPSSECRNVVVHRDLWTNNIFLKKNIHDSLYHAMFVDFQTVLYCLPMLDLSSLIYFNTLRSNRHIWTNQLIDYYYNALTLSLDASGINVKDVCCKNTIIEEYERSLVFGMTQAALITPIIAMSKEKRQEIFCDPGKAQKVNFVSRSEEYIEIAKQDTKYRVRITELFEEIVEKYVLPNDILKD